MHGREEDRIRGLIPMEDSRDIILVPRATHTTTSFLATQERTELMLHLICKVTLIGRLGITSAT